MTREERIRLSHLDIREYDDIVNHCSSNIFVTDGKGKIIYANDASERALNCQAAKLLSMDIYQLRENGYTSHSSSADAIRTKRRAQSAGFFRKQRHTPHLQDRKPRGRQQP